MVSSLFKSCWLVWETDGEAAREEQGAGAGARERGVPRRLVTWLGAGKLLTMGGDATIAF